MFDFVVEACCSDPRLAGENPEVVNRAAEAASAILSARHPDGKTPVGFDPITLIMLLIPVIKFVIEQIQECRKNRPVPVEALARPGFLGRRRLLRFCRRHCDDSSPATAQECYDAVLNVGMGETDASVAECLASYGQAARIVAATPAAKNPPK